MLTTDNRLGNGLTTSQENDGKTTTYLDTVDIPSVINKGPRPAANGLTTHLQEVHVNGNGLGKVPNGVVEQLVDAQMTIPA